MEDVLAWFFGAVAVVSFIWAVRCSILLYRVSERSRRALKTFLSDESVSDDDKRLALWMSMFMRWRPVRVPPAPPMPGSIVDQRQWAKAHASGLISDEGYAALRDKYGWTERA